jgi:chloramphenicol O-acetyltransferase type A
MPRIIDTRDAYARWAPGYDAAPNPMLGLVARALDERVGLSPSRVLELGCGTGRNLAWLAERGAARLVGVDFSQEMLAVAVERLPGAELLCRDLTQPLPLGDQSFDLVVISLVLEHIERPERVLAEAARVLAPGGRLLVLELHPQAFAAGKRANFEDEGGDKVLMAAFSHGPEQLAVPGLPPGSFSELRLDEPPPRGAIPWLLVGEWRRPPASAPIDLERWPRRATFEFFRTFDDPFFNVCADVEVGPSLAWCRERGQRFLLVAMFAALRAVHAVPELRCRLQGEGVVRYERVALGATVPNEDETFSFVDFEPHDTLEDFLAYGERVLEAHRRRGPTFEPGARDDVVHFSMVPWVHFRAISHARSHRTGGSVPKIAMGRYLERAEGAVMPVSLEVHHALVDGLHVGRFFQELERAFAI